MRWIALHACALLFAVYAVQVVFGITDSLALDASQLSSKPWLLLTSMLAHGSLYHLLSNAVGLAFFGLLLESVIGWRSMLGIFVISGIIASIAAAALYPLSLGASGAVFGVIGTLAVLRPRMVVFALGVPMPLIVAAAVWAVLDFGGMFYPSDIANAAHLGGLATGLVFGFYYRKRYPRPRKGKSEKVLSKEELEEWEKRYL